MRITYVALIALGCVHSNNIALQVDACTRIDRADPEACLAVARERLAAHDEQGAAGYLERLVAAFQTQPACLASHPAESCFHGVVAVLREPAVGLLERYALEPDLLALLPAWTGTAGPHAQARTALEAMCKTPGDPIAQQRACLVLGDLVTVEHHKHPKAPLHATIDGYAAACSVKATTSVPAYQQFASDVASIYDVSSDDPICGVAKSSARGASILEARSTMAWLESDALRDAADHESERRAQAQTAREESALVAARASATSSNKQLASATAAEDWELVLETLRARAALTRLPLDEAAATGLATSWGPLTGWLERQSSVIGAELELSRALHGLVPAEHALASSLGELRTRALTEAKKLARLQGGPGDRFLHAALLAHIYSMTPELDVEDGREAATAASARYDELAKAVRISVVLDNLAPSCEPLVRTPVLQGRTVHASTALACTIEPEQVWKVDEIVHRGFKLVVHGTVTVAGETFRVDIDDTVDQTAPPFGGAAGRAQVPAVVDTRTTLARSFDRALGMASDAIWSRALSAIEMATASSALDTGQTALASGSRHRAEDQLVIHAVVSGSSMEVDQLLAPYRVTFAQLVPQRELASK